MDNSNSYLEWLKKLPSDDAAYSTGLCPECRSVGLSFQYFSLGQGELGWRLVWCNKCHFGIRISRTKIPKGTPSLTDEDAQKKFLDTHSYIRLIT